MKKLLESIDSIQEGSANDIYQGTYGKWDSAEDNQVAYKAVVSGEWDYNRFSEWVSQVKVEEYRDATAGEDM